MGALAAVDLHAEMAADYAALEYDLLGCVLYSFPWGVKGTELEHVKGPRKWQREVLEEIGRKLRKGAASVHEVIQEAVASGHGPGKSALICWIAHWAVSTRVDARGVITANTDTQLKTKTWPEMAKWYNLAINRDWFTLTATALYSADPRHEKTWRIDAVPWSEHNTEAFAGLHNVGKRIVVLFDEAAAIADPVWEVTEGALTDYDTEIIWAVFGNPTRASGRFRECFRKYRHRWSSRNIDSRTVEGTNKEQFKKWVEDHGEDSDFVKVRVRGMFPSASFKQFISEVDIDKAYGRPLPPERYDFAPIILGVDPAWSGDDEFVIALRQGLWSEILATFPKNDNDVEMANIIARLWNEHKADACFVDGGFGTGVVSALQTMGYDPIIVWFSEKTYDKSVVNKRAEMWQSMKRWLKEGASIDEDDVLRTDLAGPEAVPRLDGKLLLESKEDMKSRGIPSPNRADALALTFAHPVQKKQVGGGRGQAHARTDYDIHEVADDQSGRRAHANTEYEIR